MKHSLNIKGARKCIFESWVYGSTEKISHNHGSLHFSEEVFFTERYTNQMNNILHRCITFPREQININNYFPALDPETQSSVTHPNSPSRHNTNLAT